MSKQFLLIGDPKGKRLDVFINCLKNIDIHNYKIIQWNDVLEDISIIDNNLKENTILKVEPPEKDLEIYRGFLKKGINKGNLSKKEIEKIDFSEYPIVEPSQWYYGVQSTFMDIENLLKRNNHRNIFSMVDFNEALIMMDKEKTYELLSKNKNNFELPKRLKKYTSYEEFREDNFNKFLKCFIKLKCGSGSTGIIAYVNNPKIKEEKIYTSLNYKEVKGKKVFFGNYKVNCFKDKQVIKNMIDWVLEHGAHIEMWIPKSTYNGYRFDTRAFVIDKKADYLISRLSKTPITNLHLKNKRMESEEFLKNSELEVIKKASEGVMDTFNNSLYSGIDVVTSTGFKPYIIDVNPFGDLFHNLINTKRNVYYKEIKTAIERIDKKND